MEGSAHESSKRFVISKDEFARERVHALQAAFKEMQAAYPEATALSLFGSLVKGTANEKSDIDAMLVIDPEKIRSLDDAGDDKPAVRFNRYDFHLIRGNVRYESMFHWPRLRKDLEDTYKRIFSEKIRDILPTLTDEQLKDIHITPLNEELMRKMLDEVIDSYRKYPDGVKERYIRFGHEIKSGEEELPGDIRLEPNHILYMLFHVDVGGGLPVYRRMILDRLSSEGALGEKIWHRLISSTEAWEQHKDHADDLPTNKRYPRTLAEAQRMYGRSDA